MPTLPDNFDNRGLLPVGTYLLSFADLRKSLLVTGPRTGAIPEWDEAWRRQLTDRAEILVNQLWTVGIKKDRHGNDMMFPAAFRRQRSTDEQKGIVKIVPV